MIWGMGPGLFPHPKHQIVRLGPGLDVVACPRQVAPFVMEITSGGSARLARLTECRNNALGREESNA